MKDVSIVIPIYNSEKILNNAVECLIQELDSLAIEYELLLCDDGSLDKSFEIMQELVRKTNNIHIFSNKGNKGLGFTLEKLFRLSKGKTVVYLDCDLPFGEKIIGRLLREIEAQDVVVASRYKGFPNRVNIFRKFMSRFYFVFCKYVMGGTVSDIGSGTVAFRKSVLDKINIKSLGFGVHIEIFIKLKNIGARIKEMGCRHYKNKGNSFSIMKHGIATIIETIVIVFNLYNMRRL